eukprot:6170935-Prymnesium_polylepis.1
MAQADAMRAQPRCHGDARLDARHARAPRAAAARSGGHPPCAMAIITVGAYDFLSLTHTKVTQTSTRHMAPAGPASPQASRIVVRTLTTGKQKATHGRGSTSNHWRLRAQRGD